MTDTTKIDIPPERKQAYDFIDANPSMPQSERLIKFAALARKQERLECAKLACTLCAIGGEPERLKHTAGHHYWHHKSETWERNGDCQASAIHERNLAETGG